MAKNLPNATRGTLYNSLPEDLTIIGIDTDHTSKSEHEAYDPRVLEPESDLQSLAEDILYQGVLQPVICYEDKETGKRVVLAGRRRVRAARLANQIQAKIDPNIKIQVPFRLVSGLDAVRRLGIEVSENEHRRSDDVIAKAAKAAHMKLLGASNSDVARHFGVSVSAISQWLVLNSATPAVKKAIIQDKLTNTGGINLAKLPESEQEAKLNEILGDPMPTSTPTDAPVKPPKRVNRDDLKAVNPNGPPSLKELRQALKLFDSGKVNLSDDTLLLLRVISGELTLDKHPELQRALGRVRSK